MDGPLFASESGRPGGERLVLLHGFTQSGQVWAPIRSALEDSYRVVTVDAPGHGGSSEVEADLNGGADLMAATVASPATWVGYSMGGRFALHVALRHPGLVRRLVLVSATAGIDDPAEREDRRRRDEDLARRLEVEGLEPFLRWWLTQPLFATLPPGAAALEDRLAGSARGLASSLRLAGSGTQEPLWPSLGSLQMPVLVVAGALDRRYAALAGRLAAAIGPNAAVRLVEDAGHSVPLERPDAFTTLLTAWLATTDPTADRS